jgi:CheY-like chemotaxis protein
MLKNLGYQADVARNGVEAVKAVISEHYDLVLMDCFMPEMEGFETTRCVRGHGECWAGVPIVAMTAAFGVCRASASGRRVCNCLPD